MAADGTRWEVSSEFSFHGAAVSVRVHDPAPDALVVGTILSVLRSVNVGNALSMVESARFTIVDVLNFHKNLGLVLSPLCTSESHENCFLVQSTQHNISDHRKRSKLSLPDWLSSGLLLC